LLTVVLNGKPEEFPSGMTIAELVTQKGLNPEIVIIEYNYELVDREAWAGTVLKENDRLEILRFVGGG